MDETLSPKEPQDLGHGVGTLVESRAFFEMSFYLRRTEPGGRHELQATLRSFGEAALSLSVTHLLTCTSSLCLTLAFVGVATSLLLWSGEFSMTADRIEPQERQSILISLPLLLSRHLSPPQQFCPDEGSQCMNLQSQGDPCQLNRDGACCVV